ncbi:hypothetical protein H311_00322 [Anncaliia algerae PRA109]|nr:hypothetical protein H311_00322 [Anncaliia algerae PRA109]
MRDVPADSFGYSEIKIGSPGIDVEIDEATLGKRKYHWRHIIEGFWVVNSIERTSGKKIYVGVGNKNSETLQNVIVVSQH